MKNYYDYLIYGQKLVNNKIASYEQMINQIFETVGETYGINLSKKYSYLLAGACTSSSGRTTSCPSG